MRPVNIKYWKDVSISFCYSSYGLYIFSSPTIHMSELAMNDLQINSSQFSSGDITTQSPDGSDYQAKHISSTLTGQHWIRIENLIASKVLLMAEIQADRKLSFLTKHYLVSLR